MWYYIAMEVGIVSTPSIDLDAIFAAVLNFLIDAIPVFGTIVAVVYDFLVVISVPVSLMLVIGTVYAVQRTKLIRAKEEEIYTPKVVPAYAEAPEAKGDPALTERWKNVMRHAESENQNDWRQAIIEADIILGEILDKMGYQGESIGEKLKRVEKADFTTLDFAWEAHKVRNVIAHEGSNFVLSQHEAKRVIGMYRKVFEEFFYI